MSASELRTLRDHAIRMAVDAAEPTESRLWGQIAGEVDAYLGQELEDPQPAPDQAALFIGPPAAWPHGPVF